MSVRQRLQYYRRVFRAYFGPGESQITFWHDTPKLNPNASLYALGEYYMPFSEKAAYAGPHDLSGIPMLDYHGEIGLQHNPIAIAQWGLGNYNLFCRTGAAQHERKLIAASNWLCEHLEQNPHGVWVWNHYFDWEYRTSLRAPWYSGLAQGQGISLLLRAHHLTQESRYAETAERAFLSFSKSMQDGGVLFEDEEGDVWFEEYIVSPPTHILNGFLWAAWGVRDYFLATKDAAAEELFTRACHTLRKNLARYDLGFWSLYEQSGTRIPMVASPFYHRLHIVQLEVMYRMTGDPIFEQYAERWKRYSLSRKNRTRALCYKSAFKLCYY